MSNFVVMIIGRGLVGIGIGFGLVIGPIYLAEISPPVHRAWFGSWFETSINIGVVIAFAVGWGFTYFPLGQGWRLMYAMGGIMPFGVLVLVATCMLESPRWLIQHQRREEAEFVVKKIFGLNVDVQAIIDEITGSIAEEQKAYDANSWGSVLCATGGMRWMMIVGVLSCVSQQVVGVEAIM